jgi:ABC-type dipeptide/oligopeptide/nickel transport system permease subunit
MKTDTPISRFGKTWLLFFATASVIASLFQREIQGHNLNQSLHFGFDPFGRNCILLSLNAAMNSMLEIIPLGLSCIAVTLLLSSLTLIKNETFRFFWNAGWEALYSLPGFIIAISLTAFAPTTPMTFPLAVLFLLIPYLIRFYEGQIHSLLQREYVQQSISLGAHGFHLFRKHIFPELLSASKAILPFLITRLLMIETSLTFVGMKQPSNTTTWGELLYLGKEYLLEAPWISFFTALPLFLTLFSFHLISKNDHS